MRTEHKINMRVARADARVAVVQARAARLHARAEVVEARAKLSAARADAKVVAKVRAKAPHPAVAGRPSRRRWVIAGVLGLALLGYANRPPVDASADTHPVPAPSVVTSAAGR